MGGAGTGAGATAGGQDHRTEEESPGPETVTPVIDHAPDQDHKETKVTITSYNSQIF